jgi:flagellar basal body P-ring protein FlgI
MLVLLSSTAILGVGGCSWWNGLTMRSQSPEPAEPVGHTTRLVGDIARPFGTHSVPVDAVGLVTCLHHTGSDPGPSPQRSALLDEMKIRDVKKPNALLSSGDVSLIVAQGLLRPGIQKGDHFDVELRVPAQSETTSLRGGYLLKTRLQQTAVHPNSLKQPERYHGWVVALAEGPVLIDPTADPKQDRIKLKLCRGLVLGGGVSEITRPLGLVLTPEHKSVVNSSRVANAVNKRFHTYKNGIQVGVAKAQTDEYVELSVHPRYKDHVERYINVLRAVAISESAHARTERIAALQAKLLDANTTADAAIELEAIGKDGADALCQASTSQNALVRFSAAEALAYLDRREAAAPLGQIARDEPAFRVFALAALSTMQDYAAYEQLRNLLSDASAETRYGAFRALWLMNENDPFVKGEVFAGGFHYHMLDVDGPPLVHVTRSRLPEVVLFGREQRLLLPLALNAGNEILVTSTADNEVAVSKYTVRDGDQKRLVSTRLDEVIRAIVELGGTYPDVVQAMQEARMAGALTSRLEVDALPEAFRSYDRVADNGKGGSLAADAHAAGAPPSPAADSSAASELPASAASGAHADEAPKAAADKSSQNGDKGGDADADANAKKGFFARLFGR